MREMVENNISDRQESGTCDLWGGLVGEPVELQMQRNRALLHAKVGARFHFLAF